MCGEDRHACGRRASALQSTHSIFKGVLLWMHDAHVVFMSFKVSKDAGLAWQCMGVVCLAVHGGLFVWQCRRSATVYEAVATHREIHGDIGIP